MDFQLNPGIGPGMQAINAHRLRWTVDGFDRMPILPQLQRIHKPRMRLHALAPHWDQAHASRRQDAQNAPLHLGPGPRVESAPGLGSREVACRIRRGVVAIVALDELQHLPCRTLLGVEFYI